MRLSDRVTGLFLVALGGASAYGGWRLPPVPGQNIGPDVFPLVIGFGLVACGALIAAGIGRGFEEDAALVPMPSGEAAVSSGAARPDASETPPPSVREASHVSPPGRARGLMALLPPLLLVFYVFAVDRLGFMLTAGAMALALGLALGARWRLAVAVAIAAPAGIHLIFSKLLRVPLPHGLIPMPW